MFHITMVCARTGSISNPYSRLAPNVVSLLEKKKREKVSNDWVRSTYFSGWTIT